MKLIRRMVISLFCVMLSMVLVIPTHAAESTVLYTGKAENFIFSPGTSESPTNLFPDFQNVIPGDVLTQSILIKNDGKKDVKIKVYLRSLGAQDESEEFLSQLKLTVKQKEDSALYEGPASDTGTFSEWVHLGDLKYGGEMQLDVILEVPITMGSEFQSQIGYIDWEFKVEEVPKSKPSSQSNGVTSNTQTAEIPTMPKTGDDSPVFYYIAGLGLAVIAVILLIRLKKSINNKKEVSI